MTSILYFYSFIGYHLVTQMANFGQNGPKGVAKLPLPSSILTQRWPFWMEKITVSCVAIFITTLVAVQQVVISVILNSAIITCWVENINLLNLHYCLMGGAHS
jgi:hypothetical protein